MHSGKPPHLITSKKSALSQSQCITRNFFSNLNMSKMRNMRESYHKRSHSRNNSATKKSRSKVKAHMQKSLLFCEYGTRQKKNNKKVAFIPQTIKFKENPRSINNPSIRAQKLKRNFIHNDKQNKMLNKQQESKFIPNRELIRSSLKPNKVNFMNRISTIYDLMIANVMLPQFVQYFLGQAIYAMSGHDKSQSLKRKQQQFYDWKLDEFKQICQKIYETSGEEDLKFFMGLSLPSVGRWNSRPSSTKTGPYIPPTLMTAHTDSRMTNMTNSENRMSYFKSLNRKDRVQVGQQRQSIDMLDKLNSKLDNYLRNNYQIDQHQSRKREGRVSFDVPLQLNNI